MALRLHNHRFLSFSSLNFWLSKDQHDSANAGMKVLKLHCQLLSECGSSRKRCLMGHALLWNNGHDLVIHGKYSKPFASSDDDIGGAVSGSLQASTSTELETMRVKLNSSLVEVDFCDELLQSLYDAARVFELAIKEHISLSRLSWFSKAWLRVDQNTWVKELSYQAAVCSLLQAANEISSPSGGRDKNANVFVQTSLLRLSAPLKSLIREKLSSKQPEAYEWFWSKQVPDVVRSFVSKFEGDPRITATSASSVKNISLDLKSRSNISVLMLALTSIAVITKLGPTKVFCSQFFSMSTEITSNLMDMLVELLSISEAYDSVKYVGLHREFLVHFGPQAASYGAKVEKGSEEVVFWVNIAQGQLQQAIDKERIWSRLTTSESIEVLEKDLAIFGFFVALGRSTQSFLSANGFHTLDEPIEDFIRYLIGGSILYYPQLSSITSYQLYAEVVCEGLDWLPFYPRIISTTEQLHMHNNKQEGPPNDEAVLQALNVCSYWMKNFIKYSTWLESPSNVKAAKFLSKGHKKLVECMEELGMIKDNTLEVNTKETVDRQGSKVAKALTEVEEANLRLENLLQELYVSRARSRKVQLKICPDLGKLVKLKREAEFLAASVRAKTDSMRQDLMIMDKGARYRNVGVDQMVQVKKIGNIIEKSLGKLKETGLDIWQGTRLLATDAAAAMGLLRSAVIGNELTEKEKKTLKRTLTDMASAVPIGVLMLLPVTAVGHAAMLGAIKRYVPALIPSTYTPERLDLFRKLEKMKQMAIDDVESNEE